MPAPRTVLAVETIRGVNGSGKSSMLAAVLERVPHEGTVRILGRTPAEARRAGLVASVPMLLRLRRRFGSWRAPALALVVFAAMFLVSTLVIGPRISGVDNPVNPEITDVEHGEHHPA